MTKVVIVRGAFLNQFELQNYSPLREEFNISAISSRHPISPNIDLPTIKLWSPADLPNFPFKYPILNRLFVDTHQLFGLEKAIQSADIVHVAETYYGYTHQAIVTKRRGVVSKIISTVWEVIPYNNESIGGRKSYKQLARENIDHFIAVTNKAKIALVKEGVPDKKITVIPMGVDLDRFYPRTTRTNKRDRNILCVARLVPEKGVLDLLNVFLKLRERDRNLHLTFVGDGPLKRELTGYKNVHIKSVPYNQMASEYRRADIFCLPSKITKTWQEQFGMSLVEAMASGLPIVTTTSGAIPEVCGEAAIYSNPADANKLGSNLQELIYNEDRSLQMSYLARSRAKSNYNRLDVSRSISSVYHKVCPSRKH